LRALGVISDVHGNLPALEAVLDWLAAQGADATICCGDVVGYGPWPNACAARVAAACGCCVLGNHDAAAIGTLSGAAFGGLAAEALNWTAGELDEATRAFLRQRPRRASYRGQFVCHGSPRDPLWEYLTDPWTAFQCFHHFDEPIGWFGHSHVPTWFTLEGGEVRGGRPVSEAVELASGARHLLNPGSVGQPRDGDWRAAVALCEREGGQRRVRFARVEYDLARTQRQMRAAGLPDALYNRLSHGR
jgi:diadenosine tetraphosphatase ApaH/serine/threonine PP2A family protein phosphatase